jgi:hypothetical protein
MRIACNISVGETEGKRPLGESGGRDKNKTKMVPDEPEWESMEWIHLD